MSRWVRLALAWSAVSLVLTLGVVPRLPAAEEDRSGFARHLLNEGDTFRAISVLKELAWFETDPGRISHLHSELGEAYRKSGRPESAIFYYEKVLSAFPLSDTLDARVHLGFALACIAQRRLSLAEEMLRTIGPAPFGWSRAAALSLIHAERGEYVEAGQLLRSIPQDSARGLAVDPSRWASHFSEAEPSHKSPAVAACLSMAIPGAGQVYSGHYFDAGQALFFVSAFAIASLASYPDRDDGPGERIYFFASAGLTALFHAANVLGAYQTAGYHNYKAREGFIAGFRSAILSMNF